MKMAISLSLLFSLFLLAHTCNAFDITQILNQYPEFSSFNSYLTQTNLAAQINGRQTITVLVVDNANIVPLSAKPLDLIKNILSVHVMLDYFDVSKLQLLSGNSALVTTLFQATGLALGQQGFLNVTRLSTGSIAFGSAMPGSPLASSLVKSVVSQPYNISIIQVTAAIIPQGIDGTKTSSPPSKAPSATPGTTLPPPSSLTPATSPRISPATAPPQPSSPTVPTTAPPKSSAATVPSTAPPKSSTATVPSTAPPKSSAATIPSAAPPTSSKTLVPTAAPTKSSGAPVPSTATPTSSKIPVPSSAPTTAAGPSKAITPSASPALTPMAYAPGPSKAITPSASPASTPMAYAPGPALGPMGPVGPVTEAPISEPPAGTTPAAEKPKAKSAGTSLDVGLAVVFTMALSTLYMASTI